MLRKSLHASVGILLASAGLTWCEASPPDWTSLQPTPQAVVQAGSDTPAGMAPLQPEPMMSSPLSGSGGLCSSDMDAPHDCGRVWFSAEYLMWWTKSSPLPQPMVTTGSSTDPALGALGGATTRVVIGDESLDFPVRHGARLTLGSWLDNEQSIGLEGSGFWLASAAVRRQASVDGIGPQVLAIPFFDATPGGLFGAPNQENGFVFGAPAGTVNGNDFAGIAVLNVTDQLWGAEINAVINVVNRGNLRLDALGGFRYVFLQEKLQFVTSSPTIVPVIPGEFFITQDNFNGRNDFYGGQLGARATWTTDRLAVIATTKVALGDMHEKLDISGSFETNDVNTPFGTGPGQIFPGGYFALPSNSGEFHRDVFAVVPEADLTLSYQLTQRLSLSLGYTFLYLSQVVRPGEQIDRVINAGQSPLYETPATPPGLQGGPARPAVFFRGSDFWAQGINFGMEFRY